MGLKKDAPPEVTDEAGNAPAATAPPAAAATPADAPQTAKKKSAVKDGGTVQLLAVHRTISDPTTGVVYGTVHATPGVRNTGNWIDAQMNAGILKER